MGNWFSSRNIQYEDIPVPESVQKEEEIWKEKNPFLYPMHHQIKTAKWCCNLCQRIYVKDSSKHIETLC